MRKPTTGKWRQPSDVHQMRAMAENFLNDEDANQLLLHQNQLVLQQNSQALGTTALTKDAAPGLMECLAMARGVREGFAQFGIDEIDTGSYDYPIACRHHIRSYCTSIPIPFTAFDGIRRSKHTVELTAAQESSVKRSLAKIISPQSNEEPQTTEKYFTSLYPRRSAKWAEDISVPLPFVSAFFDQRCPELRNGVLSSFRPGATYLLLAVITGNVDLCQHCLEFGANPNSMIFLQEESPPISEMFHGYSPMFMAVLSEQLAVMDKLSEYGGSVHVYDRWGRTPLHAAVAMNSPDVVQWLLAKGAPRYVGDCLDLIPAESGEEDFFPELAMPNPALHGCAPPPPMELLKLQQRLLGDGVAASGEDDGTTEESLADAGANAKVLAEGVELCHCLSGRPKGYCGCVDDMYMRWSLDRLQTNWCAGVNFSELSRKQTSDERQRAAGVTVNRRRK